MHTKKKIKFIYSLAILACIVIIYIFFNDQNTWNLANPQVNGHFKVLNSSDILHLLHSKGRTNNNRNSTIFGLKLKYSVAPASCESTTKFLIVVTSHFHNDDTRSAMRRAFNSATLGRLNVRRIFLLGNVIADSTVSQAAIENESTRFKDILQGNFIEAYRNLTYKHMMALKWAADHCAHARYVIKMDDDIVIDLQGVVKYLNGGKLKKPRNSTLLAGYVLRNMVPKRDPANKWYVTQEEYPEDTYPTFLSGWFYITSPETARLLMLASQLHKYFWIDDTLITGIFAKFLQIKHVDLAQYYSLHTEFIWCCIDDYVKNHLDCPFLVGPNGGDAHLFIEFNEAVGNCSVKPCVKRDVNINETCVGTKRTNLGEGKSASVETYKLF